jgi:hypothetical protein
MLPFGLIIDFQVMSHWKLYIEPLLLEQADRTKMVRRRNPASLTRRIPFMPMDRAIEADLPQKKRATSWRS